MLNYTPKTNDTPNEGYYDFVSRKQRTKALKKAGSREYWKINLEGKDIHI